MYIVTGGAGFIGSVLVWTLNRAGIDDILIVDRLGTDEKWKNLRGLRFADYLDSGEFADMLRQGDLPRPLTAVAHLGACSATTERDADFLMRNNFKYSQALCRAALERGARFVGASSAATYGDGAQGFSDDPRRLGSLLPLNMYAYSKHLFDQWLLREGLLGQAASLKFFNVYGPNEYHKGEMRSVACKAWREIKDTGRMRLFASDDPGLPDGGQMRDFVYVKDCARLMFWFLSNRRGGIYNVGSGAARSWNDLARALFAALKLPPAIEYVPMPEALRGKYQNFTQADMGWMERLECPLRFSTLEEGISDYAARLESANPYLTYGEEA